MHFLTVSVCTVDNVTKFHPARETNQNALQATSQSKYEAATACLANPANHEVHF